MGGFGFRFTDYGFQVDDRFISVTPTRSGNAPTGAFFTFSPDNHNLLTVATFTLDGGPVDAPFMVIIF